MAAAVRIGLICVVFFIASIGWLILAGVTEHRTQQQSSVLDERVGGLWGNPQLQTPPQLSAEWTTQERVRSTVLQNGREVEVERLEPLQHSEAQGVDATSVDVELHADLRRKGLMWYSLYDVGFRGVWRYQHRLPVAAQLVVAFQFPDAAGVYDNFRFVVDGTDFTGTSSAENGRVKAVVPVQPGQELQISVAYQSRGRDRWTYAPAKGTSIHKDFVLRLRTDFSDIDFPEQSLSPSERAPDGAGYALTWRFAHLVTGQSIGMLTPQRLQPGELAGELALSAPISLGFFFAVLFLLATLRGIDIHPINYLLLAGAFFAFHLLFAYTADRLPVELAFALASATSITLLVSYLRLVVSNRFAFVEAALAQLVYLVGFSLAHFWQGWTGLTVTLLAILTLAAVMQLTGRVKWSELLAQRPARPAPAP
ncbi:MAG: inner membrane CreD family protein [Deltaproteobacteria bacterium]